MPHPHQPARQHMLQEPPQKWIRMPPHCLLTPTGRLLRRRLSQPRARGLRFFPAQLRDLLIATLPLCPAEAHAPLIHRRDPRGIYRRFLHILRHILKRFGSAPHFPCIHIPRLAPHFVRQTKVEFESKPLGGAETDSDEGAAPEG